MPKDRFEKLESGAPLPSEVKDALAKLSRFEALEIGTDPVRKPAPAQTPAPATSPAASVEAPDAAGSVTCVHCDQLNEKGRDTCWACYRFVTVKTAGPSPRAQQDVTLVLDGVTYTSSQADLPEDVAELMKRIAKKGYSHELLVEWRQWRATRNIKTHAPEAQPSPAARLENPDAPTSGSDESLGIKVFRGDRVSVIRLDGKVYTSDDPGLTPELRQLFAYIDAHGVTPALMDYLRQLGTVKVRPPTTAYPSDGDLAFWGQVQEEQRRQQPAPQQPGGLRDFGPELERRQAELELERARARYGRQRGRGMAGMFGLAMFVLYILLSIFLR